MKRIICLLVGLSFIIVLGSCSLINTGSTTTSVPASSGYPESVVYKLQVSSETYLCTSYTVNTTDAGISLSLNAVYSMSSDGKITWIGQEKLIPAVMVEKVSK